MKIWNTSRSKENSLSRAESPRAAEEGIQTHLPALRFDSGMGRAGGAFALIYLVRRRGWKSHNWNPYCHPLPGWQAGKGASAPRKADLQPRQPGHGVVQTGSSLTPPIRSLSKNNPPSPTVPIIPHKLHCASNILNFRNQASRAADEDI